jgi:Ca-activated chloride channel family protein
MAYTGSPPHDLPVFQEYFILRMLLGKGRFSALILLLLSASLMEEFNNSNVNAAEGVLIDLPRGGLIRIENRFGSVTAETWSENHVSVEAEIESNVSLKRSPIVIEKRSDLLSVSAVRTPIDPQVDIRLSVKIPSDARAEIITDAGPISVRGLAASTLLTTRSGGVLAELPMQPNVDIRAHSAKGRIQSEFAPVTGSGELLEMRIGTGDRILRITSDTGNITLSQIGESSRDGAPELLRSGSVARGAGTPAAETSGEEVSDGDVIRVDAQLVTLNMSVIDRNTNRGLMGLDHADFRLFEDGVEQNIVRFDSSSAPFDLLLLIDMSGSTREVVALIRAAALRFINAARPSDRIGIISFAGQAALISPLTLNRESLRGSVEAIDTASGDTKLYDALDFAMAQTKGPGSSRRTAIVLMSDGLDGTIPGVFGQQGSSISYRDSLARVREFDGVLYTLWLNTEYDAMHPHDTQPEAFELAHTRMKELADGGGGLFYEVEKLEDLAGAYERVVADLGTVYSLAYRPSNNFRDGTWRGIRVSIGRQNAVARGKRGYYAN